MELLMIMQIMVVFTSVVKVMFFLRIFSRFGQFVQMLFKSIKDVGLFICFFFLVVFELSIWFNILGWEMDVSRDSDYPGLSANLAFFITAYRNAIGDINPPVYTFWDSCKEHNYWSATSMIALLWSCWFLNQYINLIILVNFMIAIIS
jgi:hypothetical protein